MVLSLMQPYLFPYLGYFQLMAASDVFVAYDDVQFMKGGWINRNRILVDGAPSWITLPVRAASHTLDIRHREYAGGPEERQKFVQRLAQAYRHAPYRRPTMQLVEKVMAEPSTNVAEFNVNALGAVAAFLGIHTEIGISSRLAKNDEARGTDRVLAVCRSLDATAYVNPAGGRHLYTASAFGQHGLKLYFLEPGLAPYRNAAGTFIPALSVLDVLMHNDAQAAAALVRHYRLVPA